MNDRRITRRDETDAGARLAGAFTRQFERFRAAAARLTERERLLVAALGLGALLFGAVSAADWSDRAREAFSEARTAHDRARALATRPPAADAEDATARLAQVERWSFSAANTDIAAADIEQRLLRAAEDAGLPGPRIRIETTTGTPDATGLVWLDVEVEADLRWDPTFSFLELISSWPEAHDLRSFSVAVTPAPAAVVRDPARPFGRLRIGLAFPVRLASETAAS